MNGADTTVPAGDERRRWYVPALLGLATTVATVVGVGGLGDAPSPQGSAEAMAAHFVDHRDGILRAAPFGYLGALTLVWFATHVARRLRSAGQGSAASAVVIGATVAAAYLAAIQVIFTTLTYEVAAESPATTKGLFVVTILGVPLLGAGVALLLGGFAHGAHRGGLVPVWLTSASALGAALSAVAIGSFAEEGFFSPDVQQQVVVSCLIYWAAATGVVLSLRTRAARRRETSDAGPVGS